ncbi:hypothetical protein GCM10009623_37720 [Nocardioides aestuarii]|uniref:Fasciclin domain-containing protein n=1 Tax=Nocardioides aestuarii TaxID=252231 RepID=A0ABW4TTG4_9ACTN
MTRSRSTRLAALAASTALAATGLAATASPASAGESPSIAALLAADGLSFDDSWQDFDILDQAVNDVLTAKPDSPVAALADGSVPLTVFAPNDRAFRRLVADLTGDRPADEETTYAAVGTLGVDTIETVLLYHVVPDATITYKQAKKADGARLETAAGKHLRVNYRPGRQKVYLKDADRNDRNAFVLSSAKNLNKGNPQIAHGISEVLRPLDL